MNLDEKIGPFPLGVWLVIGAGGIGLGLFVSRGSGSARSSAPATTINYTAPAPVAGSAPPASAPPTDAPSGIVALPKNTGDTAPIPISIKPPSTAPRPTPAPVPAPRPTPAPVPAPSARQYPGLPSGFVMNCASTYKGLLYPNAQELYNHFIASGVPRGIALRNIPTIAVKGGTTPWTYFWTGVNPLFFGQFNQMRVQYGLYPLTEEEFWNIVADMKRMNEEKDERKTSYQNLQYATELYAKYSVPYQCGNPSASNRR